MDKPMVGISHDIFPRIQPRVYAWTRMYAYKRPDCVTAPSVLVCLLTQGGIFSLRHGSKPYLFVTEPELIKEILANKEDTYPKMDMEGYAKKLLGEALITNEGEKWAKVRKVANHTFHAESLKRMVPEISESVQTMLERWKEHEGKEVDVFKDFGLLTTEVISRTAFGSSYMEGKHIFEMVAKLTAITVKNVYTVRFPGISMLIRTDDEIEAEKLERGITSSILELVRKREKVKDGMFGADYLGQLMKLLHESDTTLHPEWQEKARKEVFAFCGLENPTSDAIARLRIMNMILNECMRLYPPAITVSRKSAREVRLGSMTLPANMTIFMPILALHHDPQIWGEDVNAFKPERFAEGVAKATNNNAAAFFPFGLGPRTCIGLNFTTTESKIALSMILQRYKFTLSPNYVHYPSDIFILTPKDGVKVVLESI
ncbi:hypothetical protein CQW23_33970 [Capsicum baccatum]|uniref:Cytochrome n=1 Tax=Capsicum baccatum TaxID=33114 RepID=A0A2G2V0B0_CAPBA|nr:hypothetical protein CQW23_33970 [Capsicum baccatum]